MCGFFVGKSLKKFENNRNRRQISMDCAFAICHNSHKRREDRDMNEPMEAAIRHAQFYARHLRKCGSHYMIRIALKELGIPTGKDGFEYARNAVIMLCENPCETLKNGIYLAVGLLRRPPAGQDQVEQSIRFGIRLAWKNRSRIWECYFPEGCPGNLGCPSNRDFLMAIVDFVELWKACCEEVCYEPIE